MSTSSSWLGNNKGEPQKKENRHILCDILDISVNSPGSEPALEMAETPRSSAVYAEHRLTFKGQGIFTEQFGPLLLQGILAHVSLRMTWKMVT